jgi:hypothetical protein
MSIPEFNFSKIYQLAGIGDPSALHVRATKDESWQPFLNDFASLSLLVQGKATIPSPLQFMWSRGEIPLDHITTELGRVHLISDRIIDCFTQNGFRGWSTFPVIIRGKDGGDVSGYRGLIVTGRCGPIDNSMSIHTAMPPRVPGRPERQAFVGLYFDPATWDGSQIFTPNGGHHFVTEEVKDALEAVAATNFRLRRVTEIENHTATLRFQKSGTGDSEES